MKVKYYNRQGETITRNIQPGTKLMGLRLMEFTIESYEEHQALLTDRGREWFARNVNFRLTSKPEVMESNWGSDWVDDGC